MNLNDSQLHIIAGPCSIDDGNIREIYEIADIKANTLAGKASRAIFGTRVVGLKSRTALSASGDGMGIDYAVFIENIQRLMNGGCIADLEVPPSVVMAQRIIKETGMLVASEIMAPIIQLPLYEQMLPMDMFMPWNAAVDQLGWNISQMAEYARRNRWNIGLKNPKWVGEPLESVNTSSQTVETTMEKTWKGLVWYAGKIPGELILIHRGVDVSEKGNHRNVPVHEIARRVKRETGAKLYFDPSHAYGAKMRDAIVPETVKAMQMKEPDGGYLYSGILIEVGTSQTDTDQHISVVELTELVQELAAFRDLVPPRGHTL